MGKRSRFELEGYLPLERYCQQQVVNEHECFYSETEIMDINGAVIQWIVCRNNHVQSLT